MSGKIHTAHDSSEQNPSKEYLTVAEAAEFIGREVQTVRNYMTKQIFLLGKHYFKPPHGGRPLFKRSALVAWIEGEP